MFDYLGNQGRLPKRGDIWLGPEGWTDTDGKGRRLEWSWDEECVVFIQEWWAVPSGWAESTWRWSRGRLGTFSDGVGVAIGCQGSGLGRVITRPSPPLLFPGPAPLPGSSAQPLPEHLPKVCLQQVLGELKGSLLPPCVLGCLSSLCPLRNKFPLTPQGQTIEFFWESLLRN